MHVSIIGDNGAVVASVMIETEEKWLPMDLKDVGKTEKFLPTDIREIQIAEDDGRVTRIPLARRSV